MTNYNFRVCQTGSSKTIAYFENIDPIKAYAGANHWIRQRYREGTKLNYSIVSSFGTIDTRREQYDG
jgi:hypothetical protein